MQTPITVPMVRRPAHEDRLVLTMAGNTYFADIPDVEAMIYTDTVCPMYQNNKEVGFIFMSKSGNTIYAETATDRIRFPYQVWIGMLHHTSGFVIGKPCDGVTA